MTLAGVLFDEVALQTGVCGAGSGAVFGGGEPILV